nr:MAG: hypothetical protein [Molluscum contagiosum virus]
MPRWRRYRSWTQTTRGMRWPVRSSATRRAHCTRTSRSANGGRRRLSLAKLREDIHQARALHAHGRAFGHGGEEVPVRVIDAPVLRLKARVHGNHERGEGVPDVLASGQRAARARTARHVNGARAQRAEARLVVHGRELAAVLVNPLDGRQLEHTVELRELACLVLNNLEQVVVDRGRPRAELRHHEVYVHVAALWRVVGVAVQADGAPDDLFERRLVPRHVQDKNVVHREKANALVAAEREDAGLDQLAVGVLHAVELGHGTRARVLGARGELDVGNAKDFQVLDEDAYAREVDERLEDQALSGRGQDGHADLGVLAAVLVKCLVQRQVLGAGGALDGLPGAQARSRCLRQRAPCEERLEVAHQAGHQRVVLVGREVLAHRELVEGEGGSHAAVHAKDGNARAELGRARLVVDVLLLGGHAHVLEQHALAREELAALDVLEDGRLVVHQVRADAA